MKPFPRFAIGLTVAVGFVAGVWFSLDDSARSMPRERAEAEPEVSATTAQHRGPRTNEALAAQLEASALRRKNKALELEIQAMREAAKTDRPSHREETTVAPTFRVSAPGAGPDTPLPFSPDMPEPYTPRGFERISRLAAEQCGMGLDVIAVDCSEFPCIAWTQAMDDSVRHFSMEGCGPWEQAFKHGTVVVGSIQASDGGSETRYFSWMAVPPDPNDLLIAVKRSKERVAGMKDALGLK